MPKRNRAREQRRDTTGGADAPSSCAATPAERPPRDVVEIADDDGARALADNLLTPGRAWPVAVVSTAAGADTPYVAVGLLKEEVGDLAEVVLMPTGDPSWAFSEAMPPQTQVYGGASRVYGVEHDWVGAPHRSRLHFAYSPADGERVRERLVHDALGAALRAGLVGQVASTPRPEVGGVVRGVVGARALVNLDDGGQAAVAEELTGAGVPLAQVLAAGLRVRGVLDPTSRLLDITPSLPDDDASRRLVRDAYAVGDVVPVRVRSADRDSVTVELAPRFACRVARERVTGNERDRLDDLFVPGEVVLARTLASPGGLTVRLDDVDDAGDGHVPVPALALLPGGPPWLVLEDDASAGLGDGVPVPSGVGASAEESAGESAGDAGVGSVPEVPEVPDSARPVHPAPVTAEPTGLAGLGVGDPDAPEHAAPRPTLRRAPSPMLLAGRRAGEPVRALDPAPEEAPPSSPEAPTPSGAATTSGRALRDVQLALAAAQARADHAEQEEGALRELTDQLRAENGQLHAEVQRLDALVEQLENRLAEQKRKYRVADRKRQQAMRAQSRPEGADGPWFADPADQFRHEVLEAWVRTVAPGEKAELPLGAFTFGSEFLNSLALEGVSRRKVVETVVHVVTGRAASINGLQLHPLRTSDGGNAPQVTRDDGAACWRVSLQVNSPSARRLHFWRLPDGSVELSRVVLHDDVGA